MEHIHLIARQARTSCTLETCDLNQSVWWYRPSFAANTSFAALFGLGLVLFTIQAFASRRFVGFSIAMICGCIMECLGYAGRIMSYNNPFDINGFLMQICCLTMAPAFFAAGIYLCLRRIVEVIGASNSRLPPRLYPLIFIPCDFISLCLQGTGGGLTSVAAADDKSTKVGDDIMIAGLVFQAFTLAVFIALASDFAFRTYRATKTQGSAVALNPTYTKLRKSMAFRGFLVALIIATLGIFIRSVYRVVELAQGWTGQLIRRQWLFVGLEGVCVLIAVLPLNVFHPAYCFREGYLSGFRRKKNGAAVQEKEASSEEGFVST